MWIRNLTHSVQFSCSVVSDSLWPPWTAACQAYLFITNSQSLLKLMTIKSVMPSNHLILCHPLLLPSPIFPNIRVFSHESVLHIRWPKYWSFSFSISIFNEYSGLIHFRWILAGSPCSPRDSQEFSPTPHLKASVLWHSAFFIVQLSQPCRTTGYKQSKDLDKLERCPGWWRHLPRSSPHWSWSSGL